MTRPTSAGAHAAGPAISPPKEASVTIVKEIRNGE